MVQLVLPGHKQCKDCGKVKTVESFYKTRVLKSGEQKYHCACKPCVIQRSKCWQRDNPKKVMEKNLRWMKANPEKVLEAQRRRYAANPEKGKARARRWQKANPERRREQKRRWKQANPDRVRETRHRRRARLAGSTGTFTEAQFQALCAHYGNICLCCGKSKKLARDHVVPLFKGGPNDISNIQPLCKSCNSSKGVKSTDYRPAMEK